jgi:hypothetical protein
VPILTDVAIDLTCPVCGRVCHAHVRNYGYVVYRDEQGRRRKRQAPKETKGARTCRGCRTQLPFAIHLDGTVTQL